MRTKITKKKWVAIGLKSLLALPLMAFLAFSTSAYGQCTVGLTGTYSIDASQAASSTNYQSFSAAAADLIACGVTGPVTFNVAAGTYTDTLYLPTITGTSAANTITIDGGDTSNTILAWDANSGQNAAILLDGVDYLTITNLKITHSGVSDAWGIRMQNDNDYLTISGCSFQMAVSSSTSSDVQAIAGVGSSTSSFTETDFGDNITISGNYFKDGQIAIHLESDNFADSTTTISGNIIEGAYYRSIMSDNLYNFIIENNVVNGGTYSSHYAVALYDVIGFEINGNEVYSNDYALYISDGNYDGTPAATSNVTNNIAVSYGDEAGYFNDFEMANIYHNTFASFATGTSSAYGAYFNDLVDVDVVNNIIYSEEGYSAYFSDAGFGTNVVVNYNLYHTVSGSNLAYEGGTQADLSAWQTNSPSFNTNSVSGDPIFVSTQDVHALGLLADGAALPIPAITVDIDGDARSTTSPDIGADEYSPASCFPSGNMMATAVFADSIALTWNPGTGTTYTVEYGLSGYTQGSGTSITGITDTNETVTGLTPNTTYDFYIQDDCGTNGTSLFVGPFVFSTSCLADTIPYLMDFTAGAFPSCWARSSVADVTYESTCGSRSDIIEFNYEHEATTVDIDASGATSIKVGYYLSAGACTNDPEDSEHFQVFYWDGSQWVMAKDYNGTWPQSFVWDDFIVPQSALTANFKVKFDMIDGTTDAWHIDSLVVEQGPSCAPPTSLGATAVLSTSADVFWTSGGASNWNVEYGLSGFSQGAGTTINATNDTLALTGLNSNTTYDFYVRDSCGLANVSTWAGPFSFTTLCAGPFSIPYTEDFNTNAGCFTIVNGGGGPESWFQTNNTTNLDGTGYMRVDSDQDGNGVLMQETLLSPVIDASGVTNVLVMEFDHYFNSIGGDSAAVDVYDGTNWVNVYAAVSDVGSFSSPDHQTIDISAYANANLQVRFYYDDGSNWAWYWAVDNFSLTEVTCLPQTLPYSENFDTDAGCFTVIDGLSDTATWFHSTSTSNLDGTGYMRVDSDQDGDGVLMQETLLSPIIDAGSVIGTLTLEFDQYFRSIGGDSAAVDVYDGTNWVNVYSTTSTVGAFSSPDHQIIDITAHANANLQVRFYYDDGNNWAWYWAVDNFSVRDIACADPTALGVTNVTTTSADLFWTTGGASDWNVEYGLAGFTLGSGTSINATNDTVSITGLSAGTVYEFYVQDSCGAGNLSSFVGPFAFTSSVCDTANACGYTVDLFDSFGDGWNGTEVTVYQSGAAVAVLGGGFTTGNTFGPVSINLCDSLDTYFILTTGSAGAPNYANEISFDVTNPYATLAGAFGGNSAAAQGDTLLMFQANCAAPTCGPVTGLTATNLTTSSADISWVGSPSAVSYNIEYGPAGFTPGSGTTANPTSDSVNLTGLMSGTCYDFYVQAVCGNDSSTYVGPFNFCTQCAVFVAPYTQTFNTNAVPACWSAYEATGSGWVFGQLGDAGYAAGAAAEQTGNGGYYAWVDFSGTDDSTVLEMYDVDISALTTPGLQFSLFSNNTNSTDYNTLFIEAFDGTNWVQVDSLNGDLGGWAIFNIDISSFVYNTNLVRVRFRGESGGGALDYHNDLLIDNVSILELPLCLDPTNFMATGTTLNSVSLSWSSDTNVTTSVIEYGAVGFTLGTGMQVTASGSTSITGLMQNTCYDFYVQDSCGAATNWVGPLTVCTQAPCSATGIPTNVIGDTTGCTGGPVTLSATATGGQRIAWSSGGQFVGTGSPFLTDSLTFTTTYQAQHFNTSGGNVHVGPQPSIATLGFGNFTNGQYITVLDTIVLDSTTVRADGAVTAQVIISDESVTSGGIISQRGQVFTTPTGTGNHQVPVGVVLTPGNYFISIDFLPGTVGSLFRATGGAVYPYVAPGLMSIDSVNFTGPRYYYTFDLVISKACIASGSATAIGYVPGANAGNSDTAIVCETNNMVNLAAFLGTHDAGGTWFDDDATGALTDSIFDATAVSATGLYNFSYIVPGVNNCAGDTATITVDIETTPNAGNDTTVDRCSTSGPVFLRTLLSVGAFGGTWADLDSSGAFTASSSRLTLANLAPGTYRFAFTVAGVVCPTDTAIITVNVNDVVNAGADVIDSVCVDDGAVDLSTYLSATATTGGNWIDLAATGSLTGSIFDPTAVTLNSTYTFTYLVNSACGDDSATVSLYVEDCDVSLAEMQTDLVTIYPNPTHDKVFINATNASTEFDVEVISANGQVLITKHFAQGNEMTLDLSRLAAGVYSIKVHSEYGYELERIVKK